MQFNALEYVYLLASIPVLAALFAYGFRRKRQALAAFADSVMAARLVRGIDRRRRWARAWCLLAATACMVVALMQPQWGTSAEDVPRQGRDLWIILDVSLSMQAEDASPNRLDRAKAAIRQFVEKIAEEGGHRLGLIVFAGRASLHGPLTEDYALFLQRLQEAGPESVPRRGSLVGDALRQAFRRFADDELQFTDIILVSDGEDHDSRPLEAAGDAAASGVAIHTVGIGDPARGAHIPVDTPGGERNFLQYQDKAVVTRMHQSLLLEIARATGGSFQAAGTGAVDLYELYREHIADKPRRRFEGSSDERLVHRFRWFVAIAMLLIMLEMVVRERVTDAA